MRYIYCVFCLMMIWYLAVLGKDRLGSCEVRIDGIMGYLIVPKLIWELAISSNRMLLMILTHLPKLIWELVISSTKILLMVSTHFCPFIPLVRIRQALKSPNSSSRMDFLFLKTNYIFHLEFYVAKRCDSTMTTRWLAILVIYEI